MTKAQAMKEAKKRWGRQAYIRDAGKPSSQETRDAALATLETEFGPRPASGDGAREWWSKARRHPASFDRTYRRYAVGYTDDIFGAFHVRGQGDSWAEAIEQAGPPSKVWA